MKKKAGRSTREAAKEAGVSHQTLFNWIEAGFIQPPPLQIIESRAVRIWSKRDVERIRAWRRKNFQRGIGRPRKDYRR